MTETSLFQTKKHQCYVNVQIHKNTFDMLRVACGLRSHRGASKHPLFCILSRTLQCYHARLSLRHSAHPLHCLPLTLSSHSLTSLLSLYPSLSIFVLNLTESFCDQNCFVRETPKSQRTHACKRV